VNEIDNEIAKAIVEACRPRSFEEDVRTEWGNFVRWHSQVLNDKPPTRERLDLVMRMADDFIEEYRKRFDPAVVKVRTAKKLER
jgi:hypothetical protein